MIITDELLDKFIALYESDFKVTLTRDEAYKSVSDLIFLTRTLLEHELKATQNQ